ncbi:class I SAM-dependent methyltransferase [Pantoea stewartii]|uniref:class I SAM-dependent methyltransferase n=1 Tax=Pantoea stewartii TaxID=66269 RepID=UPI0021D4E039|nr:class I SAM-dependent methyltransferase [Pantoea stewartii]MCU7365939.1 class I SAM-dependent methyltransferase [Pantoea stewartii]
MSNSLSKLYQEHDNKRSDKWELYISVYDNILMPVKNEIKSVFEIGIQNGGSLEIWDKYFTNLNAIVGCDINPKCAELTYENSKINVLVQDANLPDTVSLIKDRFPLGLDLIIDDGSHTSKDIILSFLNYFPLLNHNRFMIIEDLHCSYWKDFGGGLYDPMSSLAFLKKLADCINFEHWGTPSKSRKKFLSEFEKFYGVNIDEDLISEIHSVTFYNSICIITKKPAESNQLGRRIMAGTTQQVISLDNVTMQSQAPDQSENFWSNIYSSPESLYPDLLGKNYNYLKEIEELKNSSLSFENEKSELNAKIASLKDELNIANREVDSIRNSFSYRLINKIKSFFGTHK